MIGGRTTASVMAIGIGVAMGVGLAACGGSAKATPTTTTRAPTTTTTLAPAQSAALKPLLMTTSDFPTGWAQDTAKNAAATKGTPTCVANLVLLKGSASSASVVFASPGQNPTAVIQTAGMFAPNQAAASVKTLKSSFESCNGGTLQSGSVKASIGIKPIRGISTGDAGFADQMTLTEGNQSSYLDVLYAVKGSNAVFLGWSSTTAATTFFAQLAPKAVAKI
ncbi:MAG TPA: hypothetical protein VG014_04470 [Acidimicrobiales bacterium]|nr:hypothetical protein [Acidimicrobiales bacterium]